MLFAALALFMASCVKDDDCPKAVVDANALITPRLYATVENSSNTQSPMTGILLCTPGFFHLPVSIIIAPIIAGTPVV